MESEMTLEKPFKCKSCNATFTNEDHLEVHRRRHEMSLNLGLGNINNANINTNGNPPMDGYTDQTPTPTRFFRISEEVGFFQDLQNVNPFDVEFAKASGSGTGTTPSSDSHFEFQFGAVGSTGNNNNNDTLNTPQVFGFPPSTPLPGPNANNQVHVQLKKRTILTPTAPNVPDLDLKDEQNLPSPQTQSLKTEITVNVESKTSNHPQPLQLKLNCSGSGLTGLQLEPQETAVIHLKDPDSPSSSPNILITPKKAELLERNRAAASRSRERRKQWVHALESKCASLQSLLSQVQSEVIKLRSENSLLKEELGKHGNCDVTRGTYDPNKSPLIAPALSRPAPFQPAILRSPSSSSRIQISSITSLEDLPPGVKIIQIEPSPEPRIQLPVTKSKRGRPKRGHERRVTNINIPTNTTSTSPSELIPIKVQILPLHKYGANEQK